jgi:hypothetical protein
VLGLFENLGTDVKDTITGLPRGIVQSVEHPIAAGKAIGESYAQTYGPLWRNHPGAFLQQLYKHPLGPILDVASLVTLGAGSAVKAGSVLSKAGLISETSRLARLGDLRAITLRSPRALAAERKITPEFAALIDQGAPELLTGRTLSRNPAIRLRSELVDRALKRLPVTTPKLGEVARYGKELDKTARRTAFTRQNELHRWHQAFDKLNADERVALDLIARGLDPHEWKSVLERSAASTQDKAVQRFVDKTVKVLDRPKVAELVRQPSAKLLVAHEEGRRLSEMLAGILDEHGLLTPEAAAARPWLHKQLASGARFVDTSGRDVGQIGADITEHLPPEMITRPRTVAEAKAHLATLDQHYNSIVEQAAQRLGLLREDGKLSPDQVREQGRVNSTSKARARKIKLSESEKDIARRARARWNQDLEEKTRSGIPENELKKIRRHIRRIDEELRTGYRIDTSPSMRVSVTKRQVLDQAESTLLETLDKHPDAPGMAQLAELVAERDRLRNLVASPEAVFGKVVRTEVPGEYPKGTFFHGSPEGERSPTRTTIRSRGRKASASRTEHREGTRVRPEPPTLNAALRRVRSTFTPNAKPRHGPADIPLWRDWPLLSITHLLSRHAGANPRAATRRSRLPATPGGKRPRRTECRAERVPKDDRRVEGRARRS